MEWTPNDIEIQAVLRMPGPERYAHFIKKVADQEELWSLWGEGWALASDDQGQELIPVWPHAKYAALCATGIWAGNVPKPINLEIWIERWTGGAKRDGRLIAVFPTLEDHGVAVRPDQLAADIDVELANYN